MVTKPGNEAKVLQFKEIITTAISAIPTKIITILVKCMQPAKQYSYHR